MDASAHHISSAEYSTWNSYDSLIKLRNEQVLRKYLQGYDLDISTVKSLFNRWNNQIVDTESVAVTTCSHYKYQLIQDALSELVKDLKLESKIHTSRNIFIKLGLVQAVEWSEHVTTVPIFLDVLISLLHDIQPDATIQIGDGSGHERDTDFLLNKTGIREILRKHQHVKFIDLNVDDLSVIEVPFPVTLTQLVAPKTLLDADLVISLAKLKTHKWTGVSLGMKNIFGALPGSFYGFPKNRLHWACFPRAIADIWSAIAPDLVLIDGITGIEGDGPLNGEKVNSNVIILGRDPVATDGIATQLMGISPRMIPTFWHASLKELGSLIDLCDDIRDLVKIYRLPSNHYWLEASVYKAHEEQLEIIEPLLLKNKEHRLLSNA